MVKSNPLLIILLFTLILATFVGVVTAQQRQYHLEHEWAKIWINRDGTIDLLYDINITLVFGTNIRFVYIGQPQRDFRIGKAMDQYGNTLNATDASYGDNYRVNVTLHTPLAAGQTIRFNLTTNVANMIYEDTPSNVGMEFIPTWWTEASVLDLQVQIVLPPGVNATNVTTTSELWNGTSYEDDRFSIYWQRSNLSPNQQYLFGVSFPKEYLPNYEPPPIEPPPTDTVISLPSWVPAFLALGILFGLVGAVAVVARKLPYSALSMSMETLGIRHGLTAVEASYLLDLKPTKIVTEILYSLLQKRAVWVESTNPSVKLRIMQPFQDKTGTPETPLRYYEIDFLKAVKENGTLDEEKLAKTIMFLRHTVEEKMRGYCRRDTIDYYRKIVAKAWEQVEQADTSELASNAYDEQLLWLLLDPNYQSRTRTVFHDTVFVPSPYWLWYWYGYQHYHPNPTYKPQVEAPPTRVKTPTQRAPIPTQEAKPPTIPGADFANNIATAVEKTSNNIVANLEKFANAIVPAPPAAAKTSHQPAHHAVGCACACVSCACVCACVSCACACASGGVG